jgi:hypothetical protein
MQNKKPIIIIAVLSVLALGLGYWVGLPKEGSGPPLPPLPSPTEPEFLKKGLVAYYPFNGNAKDESGNGHDGGIVGATLCTNRFGVADSAFTFSAGNFIRVKDTFGESLTITCWASNAAPDQASMLWHFGDQQTGPDLFFISGKIALNTWDITSNLVVNAFCSYRVKSNEWSQYITVISQERTVLYIDGVQVGKAAYRNPSGKPLLISRVEYPWWGQIDDVRIYNRALSEAEVKALYEFEKVK